MAGLADRLPMLVEIRGENRSVVEANAADPEKDKNGCCSNVFANDLRFFAVADFCLHHDVDSFRSQLSRSAELKLKMFERFENGEPIDGSYVTMLCYTDLFSALAAAELPLAKSLAQHMGERDELEKEHDHPFDYAMGYTLRAFVLDEPEEMREWTPRLAKACTDTNMTDFDGYARLFAAMLVNDTTNADKSLGAIVGGHQRQSRGRGAFVNREDEVLCVWGVGMANLSRSRGLAVKAIPPLIPDDLLL